MEVVKPAGPWKVEFYTGEKLIEARTMHEELDEVLMRANTDWRSYRAAFDSEVTVRLSQDDRTFDQEAVAAEYDRRFAFALGSWYMTAQERRAAFEEKYGPLGDDDRPNATVHRIFPPQEGTTP
jgi:hypothetical protein